MMTDTIKKLRTKIWLTLVGSFYALILTTLFVIYLLVSINTQNVIYQMLNHRLISNQSFFSDTFFTIELDPAGEILTIHSALSKSTQAYEELVIQTLAQTASHNQLLFNDQTWAYVITSETDGPPTENKAADQKILFVNISNVVNKLNHLLTTVTIVGLASFLVVLAGSLMLANQFIKPMKSAFENERQLTLTQKKFTENASHELRTPLTLIKGGYDEVLNNQEQTVQSQIKWLEIMAYGIKRMESLTDELLKLACLENESKPLMKDMVNINELIHELIKVMQVAADEKNAEITVTLESTIILNQNAQKLQQLMMIFLDNAIKYVNQHGTIGIRATKLKNQVQIVIENSGGGIPTDKLSHIFERFYRGDDPPTGKKKGHGLGLAIAKEIVEQLDGQIVINSIVNQITTVEIVVPE